MKRGGVEAAIIARMQTQRRELRRAFVKASATPVVLIALLPALAVFVGPELVGSAACGTPEAAG